MIQWMVRHLQVLTKIAGAAECKMLYLRQEVPAGSYLPEYCVTGDSVRDVDRYLGLMSMSAETAENKSLGKPHLYLV